MNAYSALASIAFVLLSTMSSARAQSNVTLYGIVDVYGQYLSGENRNYRVQSGGLSGSRFGLRGHEDLGDRLAAVFVLESGINADDGTNGQNAFWGRQAYVGLRSGDWGQLTLGRQYSALYTVITDFSEFSNVAGPSTAVIGGFGGYEPVRGSNDSAAGNGGPARVNNSFRYESPEWSGLRGGVLAGLGETSGNTRGNRLLETWGRYVTRPVTMMVSLLDDKGGPVNTTAARRVITLGATYTYASLRVMAGYLDVNDRSAANQDGAGWWLGADYGFGLQRLKAQYVQSRPKYLSDSKTQAFGVGWEYMLSKRTILYSSLTRYQNEAHAGLGRAWFAIPVGLTTVSHNDVNEFVGGMRFAF